MIVSRTNIMLAAFLVLVVLLTATTRVDYSEPNIEILPGMKYTPASTAYAANPVFADGRTLQSPVPGTVARGQLPLHYLATNEDALRAGEELQNPYQQMDSGPEQLQNSIQRGREVYRVFCISCHGAKGAGDGPVSRRGFPPPPSLLTGNSLQMKDGQLFHILTYGQANMPNFAAQLSPQHRWDVINFIRNIQTSIRPPETESPAELTAGEGPADEPLSAETVQPQDQNENKEKL